jgi:exopolysaccharide biosynthesis WecB/TagA/CpsF family protein
VSGFLFVAAGSAVAASGVYLLGLAVAAMLTRPYRARAAPANPRVVVLVPAHDEVDLIERCIACLRAQDYPRAQMRIVVIADNCRDDTAALAERAGAEVLVRDEPNAIGKGRALRWAMDRLLASDLSLEAVIVVDADSVADASLVGNLVARFNDGADVVQGEYLALVDDEDTAKAHLRAAAFLLFHRVRFSGRAALHLPCHLVGNGMLLTRRVLERHPWSAYTSAEDLEFSVDLRLAGVRPVYAGDARVSAPIAAGGPAARTQRQRWEGGRLHVLTTRGPRLLGQLARGRWSLLDALVDLVVPPLGLLFVASVAGALTGSALVASGSAEAWVLIPWAVAVVSVPLFVLVGLLGARAPRTMYRAFAAAPVLIGGDLLHRVGLLRGLRAHSWQRTARPSDSTTQERRRIGGVPIDALRTDEAVHRALEAVSDRRFMQICTVNLDFLVSARRNDAMRTVLRESELNLADGAPVVWLGRLTRQRLPTRVTGTDFVPCLAAAASTVGASVYFLGGEDGVAGAAAARLRQLHPALNVSGVYEPPWAPLDEMNNAEIFRRLDAAKPDILLVAFGHPKQDLWVHAHRDRLPTNVAIGVGCTFDVIAGRRGRAPTWLQQIGLEWFYRAVHEPGRLAKRYAIDACWLIAVLVPLSLKQRVVAGRR